MGSEKPQRRSRSIHIDNLAVACCQSSPHSHHVIRQRLSIASNDRLYIEHCTLRIDQQLAIHNTLAGRQGHLRHKIGPNCEFHIHFLTVFAAKIQIIS